MQHQLCTLPNLMLSKAPSPRRWSKSDQHYLSEYQGIDVYSNQTNAESFLSGHSWFSKTTVYSGSDNCFLSLEIFPWISIAVCKQQYNMACQSSTLHFSRVWEKFQEKIQAVAAEVTGIKRMLGKWARGVAFQGNTDILNKWVEK